MVQKVKSAIKKVFKSKVFKVIAAAALIYVGGAALGAWKAGGSLAKINGILVKGGGAASGAGGTAATGSAVGAAATPALGPVAATTAAAPTAGTTIANGLIPAGVGTGTGAVAGAAPAVLPAGGGVTLGNVAADTLATQGAKKGVISRMMEGAGNVAQAAGSFANKYPLPTAMIAQGVAGALTPDQMEIEQEKQRLAIEEDDRQRRIRNENLRMDGTESQYNPTYNPLKFQSSGQNIFANNGVLRKFSGVV